MKGGVRQKDAETIRTIRERVQKQMKDEVWVEEQRFENPHRHYLNMSPSYYDQKMQLLREGS